MIEQIAHVSHGLDSLLEAPQPRSSRSAGEGLLRESARPIADVPRTSSRGMCCCWWGGLLVAAALLASPSRAATPSQRSPLAIEQTGGVFVASGGGEEGQEARGAETGHHRVRVEIPSSLDGTLQPSYVMWSATSAESPERRPLLVTLHSWSADLEQRNLPLERLALERDWLVLAPNFRGVNNHPEACGSPLAQQDILDAVAWMQKNYPVDPARIYLTGSSGGGHMTLLMAGRYPQRWSAVSAWVPITDLAAWHERHADGGYGEMLRNCCGGPPGDSAEVDRQYRERSPQTHLARVGDLPVDIAAGIHDGHEGSVPIDHSLLAFNIIATSRKGETISPAEISQLLEPQGRLTNPRPSDQVEDETFGRAIYLRRQVGNARVTIFEGGHEGIARAAVEWLAPQVRATDAPVPPEVE
jgi:pimeloyl-ACP methyl ester carboxylesterase